MPESKTTTVTSKQRTTPSGWLRKPETLRDRSTKIQQLTGPSGEFLESRGGPPFGKLRVLSKAERQPPKGET